MRIVLINSEKQSINELIYFLKDYNVDIINSYLDPYEAMENLIKDRPDVVFIDITMNTSCGVELSLEIQKIFYHSIIVFISNTSQYAVETFKAHPIDFIVKPLNTLYFENTMRAVFKQYQLVSNNNIENNKKNKPFIRTFGKFEIIKGSEVMKFTTQKAKLLLAFIICNVDKTVYRDEVLSLFEINSNESNTLNNYYVTLSRLRSSLAKFGFNQSEIFINRKCTLFIADGICDYVDFLRFIRANQNINSDNHHQAEHWINQYFGEIMEDIDTDWVAVVREAVEVLMEDLIIKTADYYIQRKLYNLAEKVLKKLLTINPYSSLGYDTILNLYIETKNHDKYRYVFKKYVKHIKHELNEKLEVHYIEYYKKIVLQLRADR